MFRQILMACSLLSLTACGGPNTDEVSTPEYNEMEVKAGELAGTYLNAGDAKPVIIMVPGSGPTDRNGNSGVAFTSNALKYLAEDLAQTGISTVRVDKSGMFGSASAGNPNEVSVASYARDYRLWAKTVSEKTGQDCVYLLGHSEGGTMITAAAKDQSHICGLILVASPGRPFADIIRDQLKNNPANAPVLEEAMSALDRLENGEKVDTSNMHPALLGLLNPDTQDYLISLFKVDPAMMLAKSDLPKLVIQGDNDVQVSVADAERLADQSGAKLVILEGITHVLKPGPSEFLPNIMSYNSPDKPIDPDIAKAISEFIKN